MIKIKAALLMILLVSQPTFANDLNTYKQRITASLTSFEKNDRKQWAYTLARELGSGKEKMTMLETYDPGKPDAQQWQLIKEYGKVPSDNRIAEYQDLKKAELAAAEKKQKQAEQKLVDMIVMDSVEIIKKEGLLVTMAFTPRLPNMPPAAIEKLTGLIVLDLENDYVTKMTISNIDELSPAQNVTLSFFSMAFAFTMVDKVMLPKDITIDFKGKMAFAKAISQHSKESYSDYRYVGQPQVNLTK